MLVCMIKSSADAEGSCDMAQIQHITLESLAFITIPAII